MTHSRWYLTTIHDRNGWEHDVDLHIRFDIFYEDGHPYVRDAEVCAARLVRYGWCKLREDVPNRPGIINLQYNGGKYWTYLSSRRISPDTYGIEEGLEKFMCDHEYLEAFYG